MGLASAPASARSAAGAAAVWARGHGPRTRRPRGGSACGRCSAASREPGCAPTSPGPTCPHLESPRRRRRGAGPGPDPAAGCPPGHEPSDLARRRARSWRSGPSGPRVVAAGRGAGQPGSSSSPAATSARWPSRRPARVTARRSGAGRSARRPVTACASASPTTACATPATRSSCSAPRATGSRCGAGSRGPGSRPRTGSRGCGRLLGPLTRPLGPRWRGRSAPATASTCRPSEPANGSPRDSCRGCQRHLPSPPPTPASPCPSRPCPRLALRVRWRAVDDVALTLDLALPRRRRRPGLRPRRHPGAARHAPPAREAALLAELDLDDDQTYRLCGGRREHGLRRRAGDHRARRCRFLDEALVPLEQARPGRGRRDRRAARTSPSRPSSPRSASTAAPSQAAGPQRPTDWLDLEVVIRIGTPPPRAGDADRGDDQRRRSASSSRTAPTSGSTPTGVRRALRPGHGGPRARSSSPTTRSACTRTTWACGRSSTRSASSTPRPAPGSASGRRLRQLRDLDALPDVKPTASRPTCGPTSSRASGGWRSCGSSGSAGSSPTTWGWARRSRRSRWSPHARRARPRGGRAVPRRRTDERGLHLGPRGRDLHPRASSSARSPSPRARAGAGRWPRCTRAPTSS